MGAGRQFAKFAYPRPVKLWTVAALRFPSRLGSPISSP